MKYYVTSDVHSFTSLLQSRLEDAGFFTDSEPHKLMILGDLFDRGPEPREMQQFILRMLQEDQVILVRGNHEDLFRELIYEDGGYPRSHHRQNGTYDTALALTGMSRREAWEDMDDFCRRAAASPFNKVIIPATRNYFETQSFVFVHGWIPCLREHNGSYSFIENWRDAEDRLWQDARWINGMDAVQQVWVPGKTVVCGHYHTSYGHSKYEGKGGESGEGADFGPYFEDGILAIDASTANSGQMNLLIIEDEEVKEKHEQ